jgi:signal transduction histidine kinase
MKKQPTILIVDDNPENLGVLGNIVSENGYIPGFATNGTVALTSIKEEYPDLILLDIMMPELDGFEVCRRLKQDATLAEIPIIFLTAKMEKDDVIAGLELGAVDYVTKPFNKKELITRINTHLELQAAKKDLQDALAAKEEALVTKDKLFSIIGHDLGNIFCGLQGIAELLVDKQIQFNAKERENNIQMLIQAATNGYDLLTNLLNWSKSQTGMLLANPAIIVLRDSIYRQIELQEHKAAHKEIEIVADLDKNLLVFADLNMLDTIIRNLISNAIKFTSASGTIQVIAKQIEEKLVEISVTDTGIGIKQKDIEKLFKINAVRTYGTNNERGNGLGLVLCKELVEKCGGMIGVESEVRKGSRFYIRLPIEEL